MEAPLIVADVDTGIDDALALAVLAALHRAGAIRLAITTAAGNCTAQQAAVNSAEVLRAFGVPVGGHQAATAAPDSTPVPIVVGCTQPRNVPLTTTPETHGEWGLGYWKPAEAGETGNLDVTSRPEVVAELFASADAILVAGPSTNLAFAIEHGAFGDPAQVHAGLGDPAQVHATRGDRLARLPLVVWMAGAFNYPGNTTPTAEWNAWSDPDALGLVLTELEEYFAKHHSAPNSAPNSIATSTATSPVSLPIMCPLNVTEQVVLTPERLARWDVPALVREALRFYFAFHEQVGVGYVAQIHDLAATCVLLAELGVLDGKHNAGTVPTAVAAYATVPATVRVECGSPLLRGTTVADYCEAMPQGNTRDGGSEPAATTTDTPQAASGVNNPSMFAPAAGTGPYWGRPANARIVRTLDPEWVFATFQQWCG